MIRITLCPANSANRQSMRGFWPSTWRLPNTWMLLIQDYVWSCTPPPPTHHQLCSLVPPPQKATNMVYRGGSRGEWLSRPWAKAKKEPLLKMETKCLSREHRGRETRQLPFTRIFLECPSHRSTHLEKEVCTLWGLPCFLCGQVG